MELFYQVKHRVSSSSKDQDDEVGGLEKFYSIVPLCGVSVRNLVAFTSFSELKKRDKKGVKSVENEESPPESLNNLYVVDLNTPWDTHCVKSKMRRKVSYLEWSPSGVELLVGSCNGEIEIFGMLDNLLDKWTVLYSATFSGENIVTSAFLTPPRIVEIVPEKLDSMLYSEKYSVRGLRPRRGLNKSLEGAVLLTSTGLITTIIKSPEERGKCARGSVSIGRRGDVLHGDTAYDKDGNIFVLSSNGLVSDPIRIHRANVKLGGTSRNKAEIELSSQHSLNLPSSLTDYTITSVKFLNKVTVESVLVSLSGPGQMSHLISLFQLIKVSTPMKARFQANGIESVDVFKWEQTHSFPLNSQILTFSTLPVPISPMSPTPIASSNPNSSSNLQNNANSQSQQLVNLLHATQPLLAISTQDGTLTFIRYDNFTEVAQLNSNSVPLLIKEENLESSNPDECKEAKRAKIDIFDKSDERISSNNNKCPPLVSLCFTWSGCMLVALDSRSQLHVHKIHPNIDASVGTGLVELSLMGGFDGWDILMCLRPSASENIIDRLSETFTRQPPPVQGFYNTRILVIKAALYRLASGGGTHRTNDHQTLLTLHLVSSALKAILRPRNLGPTDKGPAEALSSLLSSRGESLSDVDKVLLHLEAKVAKDYTVEPGLLQSLQPLLQWAADLSIKLLSILPDQRHTRAPGWEVCRDSKAVGTLCELIVLMRIWGLIRPACLPSFRKTTENLDVLPLLFRLLTKLSITPHDPDETLIDKALLSRPIPEKQLKWTPKDEAAYIWFYIALGIAGALLLSLIIYFFLLNRKNMNKFSGINYEASASEQHKLVKNKGEKEMEMGLKNVSVEKVQPEREERLDYPDGGRRHLYAAKPMQFGGLDQNRGGLDPYVQNQVLLTHLEDSLSISTSTEEDECCLLPSEIQLQNINAFYPSRNHGVALTASFPRNSPLQFEYGVNPSKWLNCLEGEKNGDWVDGLRLIWLGKNPTGVKACNRCGLATLIEFPQRSAFNRAWDNRWLRNCPCGGNWKLPPFLPQPHPLDSDAFLNF